MAPKKLDRFIIGKKSLLYHEEEFCKICSSSFRRRFGKTSGVRSKKVNRDSGFRLDKPDPEPVVSETLKMNS